MAQWNVTTANASLDLTTQDGYYAGSAILIDSTHVLECYRGNGGTAIVVAVNASTYACSTAGATFNFDTVGNYPHSLAQVDTNHFWLVWSGFVGAADVCKTGVLAVNTSTWAVTTTSVLTIGTAGAAGYDNAGVKIADANHYFSLFGDIDASKNYAQIMVVNTTTFAVTTAGARLNATGWRHNAVACCAMDTNHVLALYANSTYDAQAQIFNVNTSTWAVTTNASKEFDTAASDVMNGFSVNKIDATHAIGFWSNNLKGYAQVFAVNTTTWAVTTAGSSINFDATQATWNSSVIAVDSNHFINFWAGSADDGYVCTFTVNTSTWAITTAATPLEFDTTNGTHDVAIQFDTNHFINAWYNGSSKQKVQVFAVEGAPQGPANLKSYNTNLKANIKSINTNLIANVKSIDTNA